ncbi:hypothetical protein BpHYR1_010312, partial [Brachionus plicatilis]
YKIKLTCTFLLLDSSSTFPVGKGKVEEESRKRNVQVRSTVKLKTNLYISSPRLFFDFSSGERKSRGRVEEKKCTIDPCTKDLDY